jgi:hypothetical protein
MLYCLDRASVRAPHVLVQIQCIAMHGAPQSTPTDLWNDASCRIPEACPRLDPSLSRSFLLVRNRARVAAGAARACIGRPRWSMHPQYRHSSEAKASALSVFSWQWRGTPSQLTSCRDRLACSHACALPFASCHSRMYHGRAHQRHAWRICPRLRQCTCIFATVYRLREWCAYGLVVQVAPYQLRQLSTLLPILRYRFSPSLI